VRKYTSPEADIDAVIDVRAIVQHDHRELASELIPPLLTPQKGRYGLRDYEKFFCTEGAGDIFEQRGIDRTTGCIVVVRPDQFVANILPLDAVDELSAFFDRFMIPVRAEVANATTR
jgi:phenol 2-monooxygenase